MAKIMKKKDARPIILPSYANDPNRVSIKVLIDGIAFRDLKGLNNLNVLKADISPRNYSSRDDTTTAKSNQFHKSFK